MSGLFGGPKISGPLPVVNPGDTANRVNDALARKLQSGGSNADTVSNAFAPTMAAHMPTLTGLG